MEKEEINIIDNSGDKKYFTTIPNYIIDNAPSNALSIYAGMKRYAGETGLCYASERTLCKKMRIGIKTLHSGMKILIAEGWIEFKGMQYIETDGEPK